MERYYLASICAKIPGVKSSKLVALLNCFGSAERLWQADFKTLMDTGLINSNQAEKISASTGITPEELKGFCKKQGVRIMTFMDEDYPEGLKHIHDLPLVLYIRGKLPQAAYSIAIVGSRNASEYGKSAADIFSRSLAARGIPIISGGAKGVDTVAHKACLEAGGKTVAVLGCGIDKVYPGENLILFREIVERDGAVISEYAPGVPPLSQNFPKRNRIIVGLSEGILVTECALKSGAIITANIGADEGRDVYCVPGNIFSGYSQGCHSLIRNGAQLVDSPQDILKDLEDWQSARGLKGQQNIFNCTCPKEEFKQDNKDDGLSEEEREVLKLLASARSTLSEIIEETGSDLATMGTILLELQLAGRIGQDNAQRYYLR